MKLKEQIKINNIIELYYYDGVFPYRGENPRKQKSIFKLVQDKETLVSSVEGHNLWTNLALLVAFMLLILSFNNPFSNFLFNNKR